MSTLSEKLKAIEDGVSAGVDTLYDGLNKPDYNQPPKLGGDSVTEINWLVLLVLVLTAAAIGLGVVCDKYCRGRYMQGRPRFWAIFLLVTSYLLLIPGLINPVFSFSIVINIIGERKAVEPEAGHEVCTETTTGLAHLLWKTGSKLGAYLVILFSMVIPAIELVMLILGEMCRFTSAKCAEVFRVVILWVQHRSKWASPDMFAYVLLVHLVHTLDQEPLILSKARLEIGFSCFSTFVITATVASLGVPLPKATVAADTSPKKPLLLRCLGSRSLAVIAVLLSVAFLPLFIIGLGTPVMAFRIDLKQLFPPYGPLPESARPAINMLNLQSLLNSDTSILSCVQAMFLRLASGEANELIALLLLSVCVVAFPLLDMAFLVAAAMKLGLKNTGYSEMVEANSCMNQKCQLMATARVLRKLSMTDVSMVGVYLVTICMSMYAKYGVQVSMEYGVYILVAAEILHSITYAVVDSAVSYTEELEEHSQRLEANSSQDDADLHDSSNFGCCTAPIAYNKLWNQAPRTPELDG